MAGGRQRLDGRHTRPADRGAIPEIALTRLQNVGFAAGNNVALREARGRYVLFLNPDIEIVAGTFADLVAALDVRPRGGSGERRPDVARRHAAADDQALSHCRSGSSAKRFALPRAGRSRASCEEEESLVAYDRETVADWLVGSFLIVRREALEDAGVMDERFFLFSEEMDLSTEICRAGWEIATCRSCAPITARLACAPDLFAQNSYSKLPVRREALRGGRQVVLSRARSRCAMRCASRALAPPRPLAAPTSAGGYRRNGERF